MTGDKHRDRVKNHLEAARDWLGSASGALEKKEDVKSELDLMLAEAELTRAREMKNDPSGDGRLRGRSRFVRRIMKVAPLLAALAVAAVWLRLSAVTLPVKPAPPAPPTVARPAAPQVAVPKVDKPEAPSERQKEEAPAKADEGKSTEKQESRKAPSPGDNQEGKQPQDKSAPQSGRVTVPDSSTQQMMLDAAKILRMTK